MHYEHLAYRVAYLHFMDGLSQKEIAYHLGLSTPTISRLLRLAQTQGLVQITLRDPYVHYFDLEKRLCEQHHLREVLITRIPADSPPHLAQTAVAKDAADYLRRVVREGDVIGIGWGSTVCEMVEAVSAPWPVAVEWVALHGSLSNIPFRLDVSNLVRTIAQWSDGRNYMLNVEAILDSSDTLEAIRRESKVQAVFQAQERITVSVVGVGAYSPEAETTLVASGYMTEAEKTNFREAGVVGDIVLRLFDDQGQECATAWASRTVGISLNNYRRIPLKIAVASGGSKVEAVKAALKGGLIDVLITDPVLAEGLLDPAAC